MEKIIIQKVNIRGYMRDSKMKAAQQRINEYIQDNNLDVICASLFMENEDTYIFTLTLR